MSFIRTGLREIGLKIRRQRTRMILRHEKRALQKSEIILGREGTSQAANFPELRNEIVALKKLEQEQKEVALRIAQIDEGIKKVEAQRQANAREQSEARAKLEAEKKPIQKRRNDAKSAAGRRSRRQTTSSGGGGAKKSGLSQHRTPSCVSRDCTAECAASARRRAQTSRRGGSTSATQRRARVTLPGHRQTGAAPILLQCRLNK